eukprot:1208716-Pyramimonas_sp.AAC.1
MPNKLQSWRKLFSRGDRSRQYWRLISPLWRVDEVQAGNLAHSVGSPELKLLLDVLKKSIGNAPADNNISV